MLHYQSEPNAISFYGNSSDRCVYLSITDNSGLLTERLLLVWCTVLLLNRSGLEIISPLPITFVLNGSDLETNPQGSVGSKWVPETCAPGGNYFIFIQFSAKICKIISWRTLPPLYCFCEKPHEIKQKWGTWPHLTSVILLPVTFVIKWFYQDLLQSSLLASNYCSNRKMLTFDKAKMLKYVIANFWPHSNKFYVL